MALILDPIIRGLSDAGSPLAGARMSVYVKDTTTPASVFTTNALSTPLSNPVIADSAGRFPQIFAAEGTLFDLVLRTAGGVIIDTADDVPTIGGDGSTFYRDFAAGGRVQFEGAAGVVSLQFGPPSPDDVGGNGKIEGWDGGQLETLEIDSAITSHTGDVTVAGDETVSGNVAVTGTLVGEGVDHVTAYGTHTTTTNLDMPLAAGFTAYRIEIVDITNNGGTWLYARLSYDATPTFKSGGSDYSYNALLMDAGGGFNPSDQVSTGDSKGVLGYYTGVSPANGQAIIDLVTPASGTGRTYLQNFGQGIFSSANVSMNLAATVGLGNYGKATYLRLYFDTGTFSCRWRVIAKKRF